MSSTIIPDGSGLWLFVMISLFTISNRRIAMRIVIVCKKYLPYLFMANTVLTAILTGFIVLGKHQLYPTLIFLTRSSFVLIIYRVECLLSIFMLAMLLTKLFFGSLYESEWNYVFVCFSEALTEAAFFLTIFRRSINPSFISVLILLLFLKMFHWLATKRIDTLQRNLTDDLISHLRIITLWLLLSFIDFVLLINSSRGFENIGDTASITIFFEVIIIAISLVKVILKHVLVLIEIFAIGRGNVFLLKTAIVFLISVLFDVLKLLIYFTYMLTMLYENVLPLFLVHSISFVLIDFTNDMKRIVQGCQAIRYMRNCPNAQPEELRNSNFCIICHDEMTNSAKKLPCGHIFHRTCLTFWYIRQHTCPVCRLNLRQNHFGMNLNLFNRGRQAAANERPPVAPTTMGNGQMVTPGTSANNINRTIQMPSQNTPMPILLGYVPCLSPFYVPESFTTPLNLENYTDEQLENLEKTMCGNVGQKLIEMGQIITHLDAADQLISD